jgi:hypothetical protein
MGLWSLARPESRAAVEQAVQGNEGVGAGPSSQSRVSAICRSQPAQAQRLNLTAVYCSVLIVYVAAAGTWSRAGSSVDVVLPCRLLQSLVSLRGVQVSPS